MAVGREQVEAAVQIVVEEEEAELQGWLRRRAQAVQVGQVRKLEHPRLVADRIVRFAKLVGRENVIAGADCGFAQADLVRRVHPDVMWAKFEALVEGARIATDVMPVAAPPRRATRPVRQ